MSNLAIGAAHFVAIPARYAVGRWTNIPTNTLLVFNAADLGLNILARSILHYVAYKYDWENNEHQQENRLLDFAGVCALLVGRTLICLTAVHVTSRFTEPMPLKEAALTNLAAFVSVIAAYAIAQRGKGKK